MDRRSFLRGIGFLAGAAALEQIPGNRVWSFPKKIVLYKRAPQPGDITLEMLLESYEQTLHPPALVFMESTAHGRFGFFHEEYVTVKERQWFVRNGPFRMLTHVEQDIPGVGVHLSEVGSWPLTPEGNQI